MHAVCINDNTIKLWGIHSPPWTIFICAEPFAQDTIPKRAAHDKIDHQDFVAIAEAKFLKGAALSSIAQKCNRKGTNSNGTAHSNVAQRFLNNQCGQHKAGKTEQMTPSSPTKVSNDFLKNNQTLRFQAAVSPTSRWFTTCSLSNLTINLLLNNYS